MSAEEMTTQNVEKYKLISTLKNLALPWLSLVDSWKESTFSMRNPPDHWLPGMSSSLMHNNWSMSSLGQWKAREELVWAVKKVFSAPGSWKEVAKQC